MNHVEKKIIDVVNKKKNLLFFIIITCLGIVARLSGIHLISKDMEYWLVPWYNEFVNNGGFDALGKQIGDYNILYQTIIAAMTYIKLDCVLCYKLLSIIFDYVLAFSGAFLYCTISKKKLLSMSFNVCYSVLLFLPTIVLNSAFWGQCDSIYASFVILTILFLYKEKYPLAFIMLGIAFSFKFQTIFILPFIICYYFYKKKFSFLWFFLSLLVFWLSGIGGYIKGRSLLAPFIIYLKQTQTHPSMYMGNPSFWGIIGNDYNCLNVFAIILTIVLFGLALYYVMNEKINLAEPEKYFCLAAWSIWTCVLFLPAMHERYLYILDVLLVILAFWNKKYLKYAVLSVLFSLVSYGVFLFKLESFSKGELLIYIIAWVHFSSILLKE